MPATNRPVTSREYKLMLNADRFLDRGQGSGAFQRLVGFLVAQQSGSTFGTVDEEKTRQTSFLDTPELALHQQGFSLRLRENSDATFEVNLKYRSGDRYLSAAQETMSSQTAKPKFEEDIIPPFVSKFSNSTTVKLDHLPDLSKIELVVALFPGLAELQISAGTPVETVNGFKVHEVVRQLGKFTFGDSPKAEAELSFWYLLGGELEFPLIAEFSFAYKTTKVDPPDPTRLEEYPMNLVEGADRLFQDLQKHSGWLNPNATTKTAFALDS